MALFISTRSDQSLASEVKELVFPQLLVHSKLISKRVFPNSNTNVSSPVLHSENVKNCDFDEMLKVYIVSD